MLIYHETIFQTLDQSWKCTIWLLCPFWITLALLFPAKTVSLTNFHESFFIAIKTIEEV